jgi:hypothetical protein
MSCSPVRKKLSVVGCQSAASLADVPLKDLKMTTKKRRSAGERLKNPDERYCCWTKLIEVELHPQFEPGAFREVWHLAYGSHVDAVPVEGA